MKKWLPSLLLLLLFTGVAWADTVSNPTIHSDAVSQKTDVSIAFLSSVFGTVSGVLHGTSGQMFGKLMYQFNQGMLVVAGLWLAFTVLTMVFKSATTGSFMQQDNKVPLILLRISLGFSLLIPSPSTGYTLLQGIVMQVAVQGVKLADQVWEYGLDYMVNGGALWSRPVQQGGGHSSTKIMSDNDFKAVLGDASKTINNDPTKKDFSSYFGDLSMIQKIMVMEACMVQSSINLTSSSDGGSSGPTNATPLSIVENDAPGYYRFEFPSGYSTMSVPDSGCGAVYWNSSTSKPGMDCTATDTGGSTDNTPCGFSRLALREVVYDLLPAVKKYVCGYGDNAGKSAVCNDVNTDSNDNTAITDPMMNAVLGYKNLIDPVVRKDAMDNSNAFATGKNSVYNFYDRARKDGWMVAGRYYWDLMRVEDAMDWAISGSAAYANYIPATDPNNSKKSGYITPYGGPFIGDAYDTALALAKATAGPGNYVDLVKGDIDTYTGAAKSGNATGSMSNIISSLGVLKVILAGVVTDIVELVMSFSVNTGTVGLGADPILWLHKLGLTCMSLGLNIWIGVAFSLLPLYGIFYICSASNSSGSALKGVADWIQPLVMAMAVGFIGVGFTLGFYLPLYPYMVFTFGVIGWIISLMEATIAMPLVALGITHPDGHDFLGRATQGMMLMIGIFLRPVLMLLGLFAGMILCQVSLSIILYTFTGFAADIFNIVPASDSYRPGDPILQGAAHAAANVLLEGRGSGFGMLLMFLLVFPLFLGIFTFLVYTVTITSFSTISLFTTYILGWIGGPQHHGADPQNMAEQVKQGLSGAMGKLGEGLSHSKKKKGKEDPSMKGKGKGGKPASSSPAPVSESEA